MNISNSFKKSILSTEIVNVAKDFSEIAIDAITEDGPIRDIPIIGTVISLFKIGTSIKQKHTLKKIAVFLKTLEEISDEEKKKFEQKLIEDDKDNQLFERLLIIIDQLEETIKAEMLGNLFRLYIKEIISKNYFFRFSNIILKAYVGDLVNLYLNYSYFSEKNKKDAKKLGEWKDDNRNQLEKNLLAFGLTDSLITEKASAKFQAHGIHGLTEASLGMKINQTGTALATFLFYDLKDESFQFYLSKIKGYW